PNVAGVVSSHMDGLRRRCTDNPAFAAMPVAAKAYVATVVAAGAACLIGAAFQLRLSDPVLFATLLVAGIAASTAKIDLPLGRSQSNLSLSHAVNFWSLFALGPADAVCIAAICAWAQCTIAASGRNPSHRIVFNIGSLTVTVAAAAIPLIFLGRAGADVAALARSAALTAPLYFFVNSLL